MACRGFKTPDPLWARNLEAVGQDDKNWRQLERWTEDLVNNCLGGGGFDDAAILYAEDLGGTVNSEDFNPDFTIAAQTGGFSNVGNIITVPTAGLYVWRMFLYWWNYPTLSGGSDGISYGGWYHEVNGSGTYGGSCMSLTPFTKRGSSPAGFRYFTPSGISLANMTLEVIGGPQFYSYASVSGTSTWDMYFSLARVSSLTESGPM